MREDTLGEYIHALARAGRLENVEVAPKVKLYSRLDVERLAAERGGRRRGPRGPERGGETGERQ